MIQNNILGLKLRVRGSDMDGRNSLEFKIDNKKPIELADLTESLSAFGREFVNFSSKDDSHVTTEGVRLYIKEIKSGSIIAELVASAPVAVLPFIDNANSVLAFAIHLKTLFEKLKGGVVQDAKYTRQTLENASQIIEPIAKDNASQFNLSVTNNNNVYFDLNSTEANAIQNQAAKAIKALQEPATGRHRKVALKWFQARSDPKSKTGDRSVIESISDKPVKTVFVSADEKETLVLGDDNPFRGAYVVDVDVETINGTPALYKIISVIDHIEGFDDAN